MDWRIGCSGFSYEEWKGIFYPEGLARKNWFSFYCKHFNCIEINSSFYHDPSPKTLQNWYTQSSTDFLFSMKAPQRITHFHQLQDCKELMETFYALVEDGLKEKLAMVLLQFPPKFVYSEERMQLLTSLITKQMKITVEFRDRSWWEPDIIEQLSKKNIIFCGQSYPASLSEEVIINNSTAYYRFHGKPVLYKSLYEIETLKKVYTAIQKSPVARQPFVFFNNTWGAAALKNAREFQELTH